MYPLPKELAPEGTPSTPAALPNVAAARGRDVQHHSANGRRVRPSVPAGVLSVAVGLALTLCLGLSACSRKAAQPAAAPVVTPEPAVVALPAPAAPTPAAVPAPSADTAAPPAGVPTVLAIYTRPTPNQPASVGGSSKSSLDCAIDKINDIPVSQNTRIVSAEKARIKFSGWAANVDRGTLPQEVFVHVDGPSQRWVGAIGGDLRPDVGKHFKNPLLNSSGWVAFADLSALKAGTYPLRVVTVTGGMSTTCDARRNIILN